MNELLEQREQDLLAAADIGEMLLEKNRALSQQVASLQAKLDDASHQSVGQKSSDEDDEDDSDSDEEGLDVDGSRASREQKRVSLLHETQMTQRRASRGHAVRALREVSERHDLLELQAAERQGKLDRMTKMLLQRTREAEHADETISALLSDVVLLQSVFSWRRQTDLSLIQALREQSFEAAGFRAAAAQEAHATEDAQERAAAAEAAASAAEAQLQQLKASAGQESSRAREMIKRLQEDLDNVTQAVKMQEREAEKALKMEIAALRENLLEAEQGRDKSIHDAAALQETRSIIEASLRTDLRANETLVTSLKKEMEALRTSHEEDVRAMKEEMDRREEEMLRAKQETATLHELVQESKLDRDTKMTQLSMEKDAELADLKGEILHLKAQLMRTQDEEQELKSALKSSRDMLDQIECQHEAKLKDVWDELTAAHKELEDSKLASNAQLILLQDEMAQVEVGVRSAEAAAQQALARAEANVADSEAKQQQLQEQVEKLHLDIRHFEDMVRNTAADAARNEAHMKQLVTDQMHALSRDVKTRLLFLHDCCHKTEMLATDAEVETTRFSAHVHNVREHELSALEHQIHAIRSQAKISEEKMIAEMKRKEDENQAKSQMLMLKLAQREELLSALQDEKKSALCQTEAIWQLKVQALKQELDSHMNEHAAEIERMSEEKSAVAKEAVENMLQLEGEIKRHKLEAQGLNAQLLAARNDLMTLREAKQSLASQLSARCETLEHEIENVVGMSSTTAQEMSLMQKQMQQSQADADREKRKLSHEIELMEGTLRQQRLEAEENDKKAKAELHECETKIQRLKTGWDQQKKEQGALEERYNLLHVSLHSHVLGDLERIRGDFEAGSLLDVSRVLENSVADNLEIPRGDAVVPVDSTETSHTGRSTGYTGSNMMCQPLKECNLDQDAMLLHDLRSEIERIRAGIQSAERVNVHLLTKVKTLDSSLQEHKDLISTLQQEAASAEDLGGLLCESKARLKELEAEKAKYVDSVNHLETEVERLRKGLHDRIEKGHSDHKRAVEVLNKRTDRLASEMKDLEEASRAAENENARLAREGERMKREMAQAELAQGELESSRIKSIATYQNEKAQLAEEVLLLQQQVSRAAEGQEKRLVEISHLKTKIDQLEAEKASDVYELEQVHSQQVARHENRILALQTEIDQAQNAVRAAEAAAHKLQIKLAQKEQDQVLLSRQLEVLTSRIEREQNSADGTSQSPQLIDVQEQFEQYRERAEAQAEEASSKIKALERQLDDRTAETKLAIAKSESETREREKERQLAAQKQQEAALAMDDLNQQRLRQMIPATVAMKKQEDLHRMETDELYCQLIVLRKNQSQLLDDLVALHVQKGSVSAQMNPEKMRRKLQEMLGKTREAEQGLIKSELERLTSIASAKRTQLMARQDSSLAA